ncbi:uncharacterized protein LOC116346614 isoform X2 [Contarinia nasturtii]|uniref:uncharacterized protein LOC116346614 isoform X2 n=1 Tax=Contarinia nasturtii TaxID=265458 RepID=UPI0012D4AC76|nr:uncharacterized protein LOC116346614 isoform X2 [Contarinia nasturtii]
MSASVKKQQFDPPSSASSESDAGEREPIVSDPIFIETTNHTDDPDYENDLFCPASPTTVPTSAIKSRSNSGSLRSPRQCRQRTTSINLTKTIDATESIIRANNRTIYTAGRPPWYICHVFNIDSYILRQHVYLLETILICIIVLKSRLAIYRHSLRNRVLPVKISKCHKKLIISPIQIDVKCRKNKFVKIGGAQSK